MRPIKGFDRPVLQYVFVALALVLIALTAWTATAVRRTRHQLEELHAADLNGRAERDQLEARVARERSARESLQLQMARSRSIPSSGPDADVPALTLTPTVTRGPAPPPPTVAPPAPAQIIALRLVLPRRPATAGTFYQIAVRSWSGGQTIWSRSGVRAIDVDHRPVVQAYITGDVFAPGPYEVLLTAAGSDNGPKDIASYEVTVGP